MSDNETNIIEDAYEPTFQVHRCSICNCVNREDIETSLGDYRKTYFLKDPKNSLHYVCLECYESIQDVANEYEFDEYE